LFFDVINSFLQNILGTIIVISPLGSVKRYAIYFGSGWLPFFSHFIFLIVLVLTLCHSTRIDRWFAEWLKRVQGYNQVT
jgi:hypothetical protein